MRKHQQKMFFIVGSQRSGTTLTRLILNSHPKITCYEESSAYKKIDSGKYAKKKIVGFKIPIWTRRYGWLERKFPQSQYIFLRRNIHATVCSMLNLKIDGTTWRDRWINKWGKDDLKRSLSGVSNVLLRKFYRKQLQELDKQKKYMLLAVLCAFVKTNIYEEYVRKRMNVLLVYYEDLVTKPKSTIQKILKFLDISPHSSVLEHHKFHSNLWGGTRGSRKIDRRSLYKWKRFFSADDIQEIERYVKYLEKNKKKFRKNTTS